MNPSAPTNAAGVDGGFLEPLEMAKLEALKELAYGASHEINNPLANIAARAQTLLRDESDAERRRALEAIHQQALRAHEMISDLMLFARPPRLMLAQVDASQLLAELERELAADLKRREVEFRVCVDPQTQTVIADANQLAVAIKALCVNALEAIGRRGCVTVAVYESDGDGTCIAVSDDGPGVPATARPHIFEPYYSGREAGRGLGFGLSKCWRIVADHGGRIEVGPGMNKGAQFTIHLPRRAECH